LTKIVVFDVDGTLANNDHRSHWVKTKPKNWKAFHKGTPHDTPYPEVVDIAQTYNEKGAIIVICSAREEIHREATQEWLIRHEIPFDALYMRPKNDYRDDAIIKIELLEKIRKDYGEPFMWFDDRNKVVDALRANGVKVLQVRPGDF
jgi:phosphoglycolate phosphatase-like HAD superfamily hydrolase